MDDFNQDIETVSESIEDVKTKVLDTPQTTFESADLSDVSTWRADLKVTEGKWVKFPTGTDPEKFIPEGFDKPLFSSLQDSPTGWDVAADPQKAKSWLRDRDFYIYYSNKEDEASIPRAFIETYGGNIKNVRGVGHRGNFDPFISDVVAKKISELGQDDKGMQEKASDLKTLSQLYLKLSGGEKPVMDDYVFIYGLKKKIVGFSEVPDPMIRAIKDMLPPVKLNDILASYPVWEGDLLLDGIRKPEKLVLPKEVTGSISLRDLTYHKGLTLPDKVGGDLSLISISDAHGLKLPAKIGGNLRLWSLKTAEGLVLPKYVEGALELLKLEDVNKLILHEGIAGINMPNLEDATGLVLPRHMKGRIMLNGLKHAKGLFLPVSVGSLELESLEDAEDLVLPQEITGDLSIPHLHKVSRLICPRFVGGDVNFRCLKDPSGVYFPDEIGGSFYLEGCESVPSNFVFTPKVGKDFVIQKLHNGEGVVFPRIVGGDFCGAPIRDGVGFVFPEEVGGDFKIPQIVGSIPGFKFPRKVGGDVYSSGFFDLKVAILPEEVGGQFIRRYR